MVALDKKGAPDGLPKVTGIRALGWCRRGAGVVAALAAGAMLASAAPAGASPPAGQEWGAGCPPEVRSCATDGPAGPAGGGGGGGGPIAGNTWGWGLPSNARCEYVGNGVLRCTADGYPGTARCERTWFFGIWHCTRE